MTNFAGRGLDEVSWQHKIIKTERAAGYFAGKWSSTMQIGKPDLILHFPEQGGVLMEVKLLRDLVPGRDFKRKIEATDKQREELENYDKAGGTGVLGVVADYGGGDAVLWVLPWRTERLESASCPAPVARGSWVPKLGFTVRNLIKTFQEQEYIYD